VKYLRFIVDEYYADEPMDRVNKGLFAVASYNAGPRRIAGLRSKAAAMGLDENQWFGNVEVIAAREIGRETVSYVSNIYKYYVSYNLVMQQAAERKRARGRRDFSDQRLIRPETRDQRPETSFYRIPMSGQ
jgi:membrane-bound lytic murein transglycosylase MltF